MKNKNKILITAVPFISLDKKKKLLFKKKNISYDLLKNVNEFEKIKLNKYDAIIAGVEQYNRKILLKCKNLKIISRVGIGTDSIDKEFCKKNKIKIFKTKSPNTAVTEFIISSIIILLRNMGEMNYHLSKKKWKPIIGRSLSETTIGIIGYGKIGSLLSNKLIKLGVKKILVHDKRKFKNKLNLKFCSKEDVLKNSDIISLNIELNEKTKNFISYREIDLMKRDVYIINTSRGKVINEKSLEYGLKNSKIKGILLDVFDKEPYNGPLTKYPNVFLTPHISSFTISSRKEMENEAIENLIKNLN